MKVVGCAFTTYQGAVRTAYLPLDDLTVLVGPNDTGKSSILNAIDAAASLNPDGLMPPGVDLWDGALPGFVWFIGPSDSEFAALKESLTRVEVLDLESGESYEDESVLGALADIEAAGGTPVIALELDRWEDEETGEIGSSWNELLCARPGTELAGSLAPEYVEDREYLRLPGAPVPVDVWRGGGLPPPQVVFVPLRDSRALAERVEASLDRLLRVAWNPSDGDVFSSTPWHTSASGGMAQTVRPEAIDACSKFSAEATRFLPGFVRDRYELRVAIEPMDVWERQGRIRVDLYDGCTQAHFPVERAAEGYRLWIQLALLETARRTTNEALARMHADGRYESLEAARRGGAEVDDPAGQALYIIDEPEQHLHPALQRSAAQWLQSIVETPTSQIVMSTHVHTFLELRGNVSYAATRRGRGHTVLQTFDPGQMKSLDTFAAEMGFDRGELLARIRVLLFVEGPADRAVLETLFASELRSSGTQLVELRGIAHAHKVVDDVLVRLTATPVAILLDKISTERARQMTDDPSRRDEVARESDEAEQLRRLLGAAEKANRRVHPFGLGLPDILDVLDDEALRKVAPDWPGHESARGAWETYRSSGPTAHGSSATRARNRKEFYAREYGLDSSVTTIQRAAQSMEARGARPAALADLIFEIERLSIT